MANTDFEMRNITQIAYADFGQAYDYLKSIHPDRSSFTVAELMNVSEALGVDYNSGGLYCLTDAQKNTWTVSTIHDTNSRNGFYACVVETSPGHAVVGFRGSEGMEDPNHLLTDWYGGDADLLNSTETIQHREVERFLKAHRQQLEGYDSISFTGHSLGGNLAEYATIVSGKYGLDDNVEQCISFDGPGFSNEFLAKNRGRINAMNEKMVHYRWSLVGSLLFDLPGVSYKTIDVSEEANKKDNEHMGSVNRHDTKYIVFDKNGNSVPGKKDELSMITDSLSKYIDGLPSAVGDTLKYVVLCGMIISVSHKIKSEILNEISAGLTTIYKDVFAFFRKILNSNKNYLKVNTNCINSDVNRVKVLIDRINRNVTDMYSEVTGLNSMWSGTANEAFKQKFANEQSQVSKYLKDMVKYVKVLENDRTAYLKCESSVDAIVASIRI